MPEKHIKAKLINPFKALQSYQEKDKDYFFGRSKEISILLNRIEQNRLNILHGVSGAGKSSLINAGLWPHLQENFVVTKFPITTFFESNKNALDFILTILKEEAYNRNLEISIHLKSKSHQSLWEYFHSIKYHDPNTKKQYKPLIIIDQFETLFIQGLINHHYTDKAEDLIEEISCLIEDIPPNSNIEQLESQKEYYNWLVEPINVRVLITLRSDYLSNLETLCKKIPTICNGAARFQLLLFNHKQVTQVLVKAGEPFFEQDAIERIKINIAKISWYDYDEMEFNPELVRYEPFVLSLYCYNLIEDRFEGDKIKEIDLVFDDLDNYLDKFYDKVTKPLSSRNRKFLEKLVIGENRKLIHIDDTKLDIESEDIKELSRLKLINEVKYNHQNYLELAHDSLVKPIHRNRSIREERNNSLKIALGIIVSFILGLFVLNIEIQYDTLGLGNSLIKEKLNQAKVKLELANVELKKKNDSIIALSYSAFANASIFKNSDATKALRYSQLSRSKDESSFLSKSSLFNAFTPNGKFYKTTFLTNRYTNILFNKKINKLILSGYENKILIMDSLGGHKKTIRTVPMIASIDASDNSNGILILSANGNFEYISYKGELKCQGRIPIKSKSFNHKVQFVNNTFAVASCNSTLSIFSLKTGAIVDKRDFGSEINAIDVDQGTLTIGYENIVSRFLIKKNRLKEIFSYSLDKNTIIDHVDLAPQQDRIAVACRDDFVRLILLDSMLNVTKEIPLKNGENNYTNYKLSFVKFSPNGQTLITAGAGTRDNLSQWTSDGIWKSDLIGHYFQITSAQFSDDSKYCLTSSADNTARLWNLRYSTNEDLNKHNATVYDATFLGLSNSIMTVSKDYSAIYWHLNRDGLLDFKKNNKYWIKDIIPNRELNEFIIIGRSKIAYLDSILNQKVVNTKGIISEVRFTPYYPNNVILRSNNNMFLADKYTFSPVDTIVIKPSIPDILELKVSYSGRYLIIKSDLKEESRYLITIYDFKEEKTLPNTKKLIKGERETYVTFGAMPNDSSMAFSINKNFYAWNYLEDAERLLIEDSLCVIRDFKYANDGSKLLMTCYNHNLKLFVHDSLYTPVDPVLISGHTARVLSANFSSSNEQVVSTANDKRIKIWNLQGNLLADIDNETTASQQAFFFNDDANIISWDGNKVIKSWYYDLHELEQKFNWCDQLENN